jgi:O-antigen/teichoic acid export membrane protein
VSRVRATVDRLRALGRGRSLRQVLTLVTGATAAQALVFAARPVLTRLYTPEAFGLLGVFVAPAYLLATLATLRYDDAVAVPEADRDGAGVLVLALAGSVAAGVLLALLVPFRLAAAAALGAPEVAPFLLLIPIVVAALGVASATQSWLARAERFRAISWAVLAQAVVSVGVQLLFRDRAAWGLVAGAAAGAVVLATVGLAAAARSGAFAASRQADLPALARRFRRFPAFGLPASGMTQLAARLPPLVLVGAFETSFVGLFTVALASVAVPIGLVTDAVGQVFYVRAAEARRAGRLGPLVERSFARLVAFAAFPVAAVAVLGPDLFAVVFGEPWREAGVIARELSPWLLLAAVAPPLTRAFDVTERQRDELRAGAWTAALVGSALAVGAWVGDATAALRLLAVGGALARLVQLGIIARVAGAPIRRMGLDLAWSVAAAALVILPVGAALSWGGLGVGLAAAVVAAPLYAGLVLPLATRGAAETPAG